MAHMKQTARKGNKGLLKATQGGKGHVTAVVAVAVAVMEMETEMVEMEMEKETFPGVGL